jgi:hypothetical protein
MIDATLAGRRAFILENTRLQAPPHTPELRLHLADEITPIWTLTEEALAEIGLPPPFWAFAWAGGQALARYILDNPALVSGKRVIDFASGSGLVALGGGGRRADRRPGPRLLPQARAGQAGRIPGADHPRAGGHGRQAHQRLDSALTAS